MLPMKTFNRPVVTLYSSLFLASIKDDPYSIIRNSHGAYFIQPCSWGP